MELDFTEFIDDIRLRWRMMRYDVSDRASRWIAFHLPTRVIYYSAVKMAAKVAVDRKHDEVLLMESLRAYARMERID